MLGTVGVMVANPQPWLVSRLTPVAFPPVDVLLNGRTLRRGPSSTLFDNYESACSIFCGRCRRLLSFLDGGRPFDERRFEFCQHQLLGLGCVFEPLFQVRDASIAHEIVLMLLVRPVRENGEIGGIWKDPFWDQCVVVIIAPRAHARTTCVVNINTVSPRKHDNPKPPIRSRVQATSVARQR
jgi:hypothetical protein